MIIQKKLIVIKKAAELGEPKAFHKLGEVFLKRDNILQDKVLAIDIFQKSADLNRMNILNLESLVKK